jgi:hypothetical protein
LLENEEKKESNLSEAQDDGNEE